MALFIPRQPAFDNLLKAPTGTVGKSLIKRAHKVQFHAKRQVGVKTGRLRDSINVVDHRPTAYGQSIKVGSSVSYALLHHNGSKPHIILPVRAKELVFISSGRVVRTNRVNHPGTRPNRYLTDNLRYALL